MPHGPYLLLVVASACTRLEGPLAFEVDRAMLVPCTAEDGVGYVFGYIRSGVPDDECFAHLDDAPPSTPSDDPCAGTEDYRDPSLGLCGPDMIHLARFAQQMSWLYADVPLDDLTHLSTDTADYVECGGDRLDLDGPNTHTTLVGSIVIGKDRGDSANVEFDLDALSGTGEFAICR